MKSKIRKIVAVFVSISILALSVCVPRSYVTAYINSANTYNVYDGDTGVFQSTYTLSAASTLSSSVSTYDVLLPDDTRVVDYTKSGVVKINIIRDNIQMVETGFVVDDHTIATAGHCVYLKQSGKSASGPTGIDIVNILLFDGDGEVELTITSVDEIHVPQLYVTTAKDNNFNGHKYDYALITVDADLSDYAMFNLGVMMDEFPNTYPNASITGFPKLAPGEDESTANTHTDHEMYTGTGVIADKDDYRIYYNIPTESGQSGSPVYLTTTFQNKTYYTVIGIHTYGGARPYLDEDGNPTNFYYNAATRMTTNQLQFYKNNPNI